MSTHLGNAGHCGRLAYITDRTSVACWEAMPVKMICRMSEEVAF